MAAEEHAAADVEVDTEDREYIVKIAKLYL
jgi:hypothetical protein